MPDIFCIILGIAIAYLFAGKPMVDLPIPSSPMGNPAQSGRSSEAIKKQQDGAVGRQVNEDDENKEIKARNIFAANGAYTDSDNKPIPENPYTLIGVIQGKETKAIFRDYTGSIVTGTAGQKMRDGFIIIEIDDASVKLRKGKEEREMKAFAIPNREKTILENP